MLNSYIGLFTSSDTFMCSPDHFGLGSNLIVLEAMQGLLSEILHNHPFNRGPGNKSLPFSVYVDQASSDYASTVMSPGSNHSKP